MYRSSAKPKKVIKLDASNIPVKYLEWFIKGVDAAMKAHKELEEATDGK